jgi:putative spermidine/putrescine transport system ATP-binding protein
MRYGGFAALDNVSLSIESGEFITLLGPSGSGKTTLLMVLAGFTRPNEGSVTFGDREVVLLPPHKRDIGMVFQNYALFPHMTVAGNLAYPLKLRGYARKEIADRVAKALDLVQLGGYGERSVEQLSGGQRQRIALARAVIFEPRILLMDEPLSALDKKLREQMQLEVRRLHDRLRLTTVYVTHDQREALTMSDRIAVINKGKVIQVARPRELYDQPHTRFVADFIGESHMLPVTVRDGRADLFGKPLRMTRPLLSTAPDQILVLRPEKLSFLKGTGSEDINQLEGKVRQHIFQGDSVMSYVTIADGSEVALRVAQTAETSLPEPGTAVRLGFAAADTIIVPADTDAGQTGKSP